MRTKIILASALALTLMGIRPADYLLSPMVWAMTLAMPVITAAGMVGASIASLLAAIIALNQNVRFWGSVRPKKRCDVK